MPERIEWLNDGSASGAPYSPRFEDRYRSELGGIDQAQEVFLAGCGLPAAWAAKPQWCILETGFGLGLNFLVTWAAWQADPLRPRLLHFVSTEAYPASAEDVLRGAVSHPELLPLAAQLQAQLWGLLPGFHRLVFEAGNVLLTLCVGDAKSVLRQQDFAADSVYLDGFSPKKNPDIWDMHTLKAVARCCRRGTRVATWTVARSVRDALAQCGFVMHKTLGVPPKRDNLQGEYNPPWEPKKPARKFHGGFQQAGTCVVIGAGLAGAAVAASLARRGWQVVVLDAADSPASGASGLPAGLLAPHVSIDDSLLSRLSRAGVRATLQQAHCLLAHGADWQHTGVLEHGVDGSPKILPSSWAKDWSDAAADWSRIASAKQLAQCGLPAATSALWHAQAGWIKPASLVKAWLVTPGIQWQGNSQAAQLLQGPQGWQVFSPAGDLLAQADLVVLAAGCHSRALAETVNPTPLALQPIRGQLSWGLHNPQDLPPFPVNGHGGLIPAIQVADGLMWVMGSSYQRDCETSGIRFTEHYENLKRLQTLAPESALQLNDQFKVGKIKGWAGVRCATPTRLPMLGRIALADTGAEVWVCSGMGSRGLTFAGLCAELLAARLHGEPLPIENRLTQAFEPARGVSRGA